MTPASIALNGFIMPLPIVIVVEGIVCLGCPVLLFVRSYRLLLPRYPMNGLKNFDKTDWEYSLAPTDDLIRFWRSKVKVAAAPSSSDLLNTTSHELLEQSR